MKLVKMIKAQIEVAKGIKLGEAHVFTSKNGKKYNVFTNNTAVFAFSGITNKPMAITTIGNTGFFGIPTKIIIVNDEFWEISANTKKCILEHEVSHIEKGHLDFSRGKLLLINLERMFHEPQIEKDADFDAACRVGVMNFIDALLELNSYKFPHCKSRSKYLLDREEEINFFYDTKKRHDDHIDAVSQTLNNNANEMAKSVSNWISNIADCTF